MINDFSPSIIRWYCSINSCFKPLLITFRLYRDTSGTASPLISARQAIPNNPSAQSSPTRLPAAASTDNGSQGGLPPQHALERQNSGEGGANGRHRSRSPSKFSSASRAPAERADSDAPSGLDFLLQACDMLEPEDNVTSKPRPVGRPARKNGGQRPRRFSDDGEYAPGDSSEDEEYRPSRANRAARRAQGGGDGSRLASAAPASAKWERGMVHGPCTNPDCEHPEDSPQWRKGPAQYPVLCNACGTRWLRNGTLKPLVVCLSILSSSLYIFNVEDLSLGPCSFINYLSLY